MTDVQDHQTLVRKLLLKCNATDSRQDAELIETHISSVILVGDLAFKIKKPVNFGFLNFTRLSDRKHFCEEEIRLNSRLAPTYYLHTVAITGSCHNPQLEGQGPAIEYAVKMRRFDQDCMLDHLLDKDGLNVKIIDSLADQIARFHQQIEVAEKDSSFASPAVVFQPMQENFTQIRATSCAPGDEQQLQRIQQWTTNQFENLTTALETRKQTGFIRECHGDMHLGNMFQSGQNIIIFDGIEFNENLRWIDVISELAFITMDLTARGADFFARRLLNRYLEISGDYEGLKLLRFYQVYRAMVRAKVTRLNRQQVLLNTANNAKTRSQLEAQYQTYIQLALRFTHPSVPSVFLMYGFSASGKSTVSSHLLEHLGAIRIRSDRERKRLFGDANGKKNDLNAGIYQPQATEKTYHHLLLLTESIVSAGFAVIVDATFLKAAQRGPFQKLAQKLGVLFRVLQLTASIETLQHRLHKRDQQVDNISDATRDVIRQQLAMQEPLTEDEPHTRVDTEKHINYAQLAKSLLAKTTNSP